MHTSDFKIGTFKPSGFNAITFFLLIALIVTSACNRQGNNTAEKPKRIRLVAGQIKEVSIPAPKDTTIQVVASSENNEIVDVSPQASTTGQENTGRKSKATFLIKGITAGAVKVVFSEKKINEEGAGNIRKTYQVQVVNK